MREVAFVSGGSRGIGAAIVTRFAAAGLDVAFTYVHSGDRARALASELERAHGGRVLPLECDVRSADAARATVADTLERLGRLDVVVNNAGITRDQNLMSMTDAEWRDVIDTNVHGTFHVTRAAIGTLLRQRSGSVVNVSSVAGLVGLAGMTNYAASKAAIIGFTRSLAKECAPRSVTVNALAPGFVETEMLDDLDPRYREQMIASVPLKRFGTAVEVAELAYYLTRPEARYITGQAFVIDGGLSL
jgi:3-oxoacyl-[acyl-carrier protein] reductase